jgi:glyoxylase-like metal-dependent hydrolase (beta-lactamase superfamily II)
VITGSGSERSASASPACRPWQRRTSSRACASGPRAGRSRHSGYRDSQARSPEDNPVAHPLDGPFLELEGHPLIPVNLGHTDTDGTTALHVPDIGLIVAGDAVYNGVHQYLAESDSHGRQDWLAALDVIEALGPRAVVAGHKRYGNDDNPRTIEETRQYIRDFDRLDQATNTAEELYRQMLAIYPHRVNPGALWLSVQSAKA